MPRVSIGMPVYNGEPYLELALQSLLEQTFDDFELLISDNASSDRTEEICQEYAARDSRIRYERAAENLGAARNYNRVFEMSSGEYFKWAAHDDLCAPTYLERCVEALDGAPVGVVLAYPRTLVIDADGKVDHKEETNLDVSGARPRDRLCNLLRNLVFCNPVFGLIRSSALRTTGLIGSYNSSDCVTLAQLALQGAFQPIPQPLFYRRLHPGRSCDPNRTAAQVAKWFDPENRDRAIFPRGRLLVEHLRAVACACIPATEKMRCLQLVLSELFVKNRQWRMIGGELKRSFPRRRGLC